MRALVLESGGPCMAQVPMPRPAPGEALIQVLAAGICNTDIELLRGYMGFRGVPGHEFVGQVTQSSNEQLLGKRVVGEINCVCHTCQFCQLEMPNHCLNRSVLGILNRNGAFAEFVTLPEENLHVVPNSIRDDVAVFTEPAAAAFRILEQVEVLPSDRVIVLGDGKLGQLIAQVLWIKTKRLACVGKHPWKLDLLRKLNIATAHVDEPIEGMADIVVDATGSYGGLQRALELVRPEGTIMVKTTTTHPTALDFSGPVINEVRIIGSRCGPFRPALEALAMGNIEVRPMISESYSLADGVYALERAQAGEVMKVVLHM